MRAVPVARREFRVLVACVGCLLGILGCQENARPNLVLVTLDTTRADHLSSYGYAIETSPTQLSFRPVRVADVRTSPSAGRANDGSSDAIRGSSRSMSSRTSSWAP